MKARIREWWISSVRLGREQRLLFYQALGAQLSAGVAPAEACRTLASLGISPEMAALCRSGAQAGADGLPLADGMAGWLPRADIGLLRVAERHDALGAAVGALADPSDGRRRTFAAEVLAPNAYYLFVLCVLLLFAWEAKPLLESMDGFPAAGNPAHELSLLLRSHGPPALLCGLAAAAFAAVGRARLRQPWRRALGIFDLDYRLGVGIAAADLGARLSEHGGSHADWLDAVDDALGTDSPYVRRAVRDARQRLAEGQPIEAAISGGLLPEPMARALEGLAPGGERAAYAGAWSAVGGIQRVLLRRRHGAWRAGVRLAALAAVVALIATLAQGIYGAFLTSEIGATP